MNGLAVVYTFKIIATLVVWCIPLLLFPGSVLEQIGLPSQEETSYMFLRMLGWAYLALCVGYGLGLQDALVEHDSSLQDAKKPILEGPVLVGLVSNGGAFLFLSYYGFSGTWNDWGWILQFIGWSSVVATVLITTGLAVFGAMPILQQQRRQQRQRRESSSSRAQSSATEAMLLRNNKRHPS